MKKVILSLVVGCGFSILLRDTNPTNQKLIKRSLCLINQRYKTC
ncbi:hypothetical protein [Bacillus sp. AFS041924]|nr:hypothetical protein [Bacillus sp. AFS041924]